LAGNRTSENALDEMGLNEDDIDIDIDVGDKEDTTIDADLDDAIDNFG